MALRLTLSRDLRFGWLVDPDQQRTLILDSELCVAALSRALLLSAVWQS
jgi:hypothetical protein